jgi:hypothetical protein
VIPCDIAAGSERIRKMSGIYLELSNTLYLIRHPLFIGAPSGVHAIGTSVKNCLYPADIAFFYPKELRDLPGPVQVVMVEKAECENNAAFPVHCHKAAITDSCNKPQQAGFELFFTAP